MDEWTRVAPQARVFQEEDEIGGVDCPVAAVAVRIAGFALLM